MWNPASSCWPGRRSTRQRSPHALEWVTSRAANSRGSTLPLLAPEQISRRRNHPGRLWCCYHEDSNTAGIPELRDRLRRCYKLSLYRVRYKSNPEWTLEVWGGQFEPNLRAFVWRNAPLTGEGIPQPGIQACWCFVKSFVTSKYLDCCRGLCFIGRRQRDKQDGMHNFRYPQWGRVTKRNITYVKTRRTVSVALLRICVRRTRWRGQNGDDQGQLTKICEAHHQKQADLKLEWYFWYKLGLTHSCHSKCVPDSCWRNHQRRINDS